MYLGERIMILGSAGSGKSTLAARLGEITDIPVIHLDRIFWNPGRVETPGEEMTLKAMEAAASERWIMDGNYSATLDLRIERADTIIFIDFSRFLCIFRALKRRIENHGKTRFDLAEGCIEKIDLPFLKWIWGYPKRSRKNIIDKIENSGKSVYHLKTRKDVSYFIDNIRAGYMMKRIYYDRSIRK